MEELRRLYHSVRHEELKELTNQKSMLNGDDVIGQQELEEQFKLVQLKSSIEYGRQLYRREDQVKRELKALETESRHIQQHVFFSLV